MTVNFGSLYENKVKTLFHYIDARKWNNLEGMLHDEVEYYRPGYSLFVGKLEVMDFYKNERVVADGHHAIECVTFSGERLSCWGEFLGVLKNAEHVSVRFADVYQLKEKRIYRRETFFSKAVI